MFSCKVNPCVFIGVRHTYQTIVNSTEFRYRENPGPTPVCINPSKTITAPYS